MSKTILAGILFSIIAFNAPVYADWSPSNSGEFAVVVNHQGQSAVVHRDKGDDPYAWLKVNIGDNTDKLISKNSPLIISFDGKEPLSRHAGRAETYSWEPREISVVAWYGAPHFGYQDLMIGLLTADKMDVTYESMTGQEVTMSFDIAHGKDHLYTAIRVSDQFDPQEQKARKNFESAFQKRMFQCGDLVSSNKVDEASACLSALDTCKNATSDANVFNMCFENTFE